MLVKKYMFGVQVKSAIQKLCCLHVFITLMDLSSSFVLDPDINIFLHAYRIFSKLKNFHTFLHTNMQYSYV